MAEMLSAARDLYGLAPSEFTAARNALAKQLKADGHADEAKAIAALRRPKAAENALNRLARHDREVVRRFAEAIGAAQKAQAAAIGGDAAALRDATNELRQATAAVTDAAVRGVADEGGNGEAQRDEISTMLRDFISGASAAPLVAGVLGAEALGPPEELFPGAPDPPPASASRPSSTTKGSSKASGASPRGEGPGSAATPREPSASAKATAEAKQAMRRAEHARLREQLKAAESAVTKASDAVDQIQSELLTKRAALKAAQANRKAAEQELDAFEPD